MSSLSIRVVGVLPTTAVSGSLPHVSSWANVSNVAIVNDTPIPVSVIGGVTEDTVVSVSGHLQDQISSIVVSGGGTLNYPFENTTQVICPHNLNSVFHTTVVLNENGQLIEGAVLYGPTTDVVNFNYLQSGTVIVS